MRDEDEHEKNPSFKKAEKEEMLGFFLLTAFFEFYNR